MKRKLTMDGAGRVVLPQPVRQHFHLERGSELDMQIETDAIVLRPQPTAPALTDQHGLLVYEGEAVGDLVGAVTESRRRRDRDVSGPLA